MVDVDDMLILVGDEKQRPDHVQEHDGFTFVG